LFGPIAEFDVLLDLTSFVPVFLLFTRAVIDVWEWMFGVADRIGDDVV